MAPSRTAQSPSPPLTRRGVKVNETTAAYLRGVSYDTQRRHRKAGKGARAYYSPTGRPEYFLSEIEDELQARAKEQAS